MGWEWMAPAATAVVGVVGIAGTVWSSTRAQRSQLEALRVQAKMQASLQLSLEKRALYAKFLRQVEIIIEVIREGHQVERALARDRRTGERRDELEERIRAARVGLKQGRHELGLLCAEMNVVAGPSMGHVATRLVEAVNALNRTDRPNPRAAVDEVLRVAVRAMHHDVAPDANDEVREVVQSVLPQLTDALLRVNGHEGTPDPDDQK
ncbi:hypothetical protein [Micromonospora saelicesensis]|uniref:hypothetical protein n=1 Tax=Micromonospora saelicesensis TaxID=285676 RepID=UPI0011BFD983|nr:hypothetical protein [Micromonospora saelicesensis]